MAWEHLSVNKPHLVYIILGGFTTLFMLCSSVIKERLYIGEATVATICGIIFGPHAANLIDPGTWGNTDQITLEFSRIVLVVQCFAVGVELPKAYMERHWKSVTFLLVPVMTFGWLITSLFIWALFGTHLNWLDSLCIAACVTATDPVLASSVVGKGKFAKRVPKHLRDLLSAESGCNDGMAFPFIYLAVYIIRYKGHPNEVSLHWFCYTILYECIFGAVFGFLVGYFARLAVRYAHERDLIDRESFLVFYFVLALFCAGAGSMLGADDLLIGFAAGIGFSNDGWFTEKTEESHVSNVIDLLINLAFFVYFGTIVPWAQFNSGFLGLDVWRLVVLALLVLFFRRIPIMLALKPLIPDIKTWREALFAGHFGPIGVGAIFIAILARAELESEHGSTTPLAVLPPDDFPHMNIIELIWPITTFLVITSIVVHGSSIAVFTLGKHINTLTLTMSYTQANEEGPSWMERLPRIQSRSMSKSSMSFARSDTEIDEKEKALSPHNLQPGTFLRRQKEEDMPHGRTASRHRSRRSRNMGIGGPISQSAIHPERREESGISSSRSDSDTLAAKGESPPSSDKENAAEIYEEGHDTVYEDAEGNVLAVEPTIQGETPIERQESEVQEGKRLMRQEGADHNHGVAPTYDDPNHDTADRIKAEAEKVGEQVTGATQAPPKPQRRGLSTMGTLNKISTLAGMKKKDVAEGDEKPKPETKRAQGPARAYQYGNTIIVEDEDGEVIKKYDIGPSANKQDASTGESSERSKQSVGRMGKMLGLNRGESKAQVPTVPAGQSTGEDGAKRPQPDRKRTTFRNNNNNNNNDDDGDDLVRFTMSTGGRRMSKAEFIDSIKKMDPKSRVQAVENSDVPEAVKREARKDAREHAAAQHGGSYTGGVPVVAEQPEAEARGTDADDYFTSGKKERSGSGMLRRTATNDEHDTKLKLIDSNDQEVPVHDVSATVRGRSSNSGRPETAAERRRRAAAEAARQQDEDSEDDGTERVPPKATGTTTEGNLNDGGETAAEKRRREGALGVRDESDSEDEGPLSPASTQQVQRQSTLKWGKNVKG
jgi:NhaP-type Na+/H+ or K+/H+ antiporter